MIDYTVLSSTDGTNFAERQGEIADTKVTMTGFTLGLEYTFKVKSRNAFGFSAVSNSITILAAKTPE